MRKPAKLVKTVKWEKTEEIQEVVPAIYSRRDMEEAEEIRRLLASGGYGARRRNWVKSSFAVGFNQRN
jgi:hypothetical protein